MKGLQEDLNPLAYSSHTHHCYNTMSEEDVEIQQTIGNIDSKVDELGKTAGSMAKKLDDVMLRTTQIIEMLAVMRASGGSSAAPAPIQPSSAAPPPRTTSAFNLSVTTRGYKQSKLSATGYTINPSPMYHDLLSIVNLESECPGAKDAVIDVIASSFFGFSNGILRPEWDALAKDPATAMIASYVANQRQRLIPALEPFTKPDFNMADPANKTAISTAQKLIGSVLTSEGLPQVATARENLATLFQSVASVGRQTFFQPPSTRTTNKALLSQTYLGRAWSLRLPSSSQAKFSLGAFDPKAPVPVYVFQGAAPAASPVVGQPVTGTNAI